MGRCDVTERTERTGGARIALGAVIVAMATVAPYWLATRGANAEVSWHTLTAVVLAALGLGAGAAIVSGKALGRWTTWESVLVAVLAGVVGVLFWAWGLLWNLLDVIKVVPGYGMALRDLFYGFWFLAAILAPYIVRKPGAAVAAELVAAIISALVGSQWGLTVLVSGLIQGGLAEVVFAVRGYRHYDLPTLAVAAAAAALGSWVVDYAFWYNTLELDILLLMLLARIISAAILSSLLGMVLGNALARTGVLDNTVLGRARMES
jgi:energy-coupling factor transport system substrate-specific component